MHAHIGKHPKFRGIFILFLSVLLAFSACGRKNQASVDPVLTEPEEARIPEYSLPHVEAEEVVFPERPLRIGGEDTSLINILLIGQDRGSERPHEGDRTHADVILLCTFHTELKRLTFTSFQRDIFVDIPGVGPDKLSMAYIYGGMELLGETMKRNFGVRLNGCVEVDFDDFSKVVDALGGVTVEITRQEAEEINRLNPGGNLEEGYQHMNGAQTLSYCRIRHLDSDYQRVLRQQKTLEALLQQSKNMTLGKAVKVASALIPMVESDLSVSELLDLVKTLFPMAREFMLYNQRIPIPGTYQECIIDEKWVFRIDFDLNSKYLYDTLFSGLEWK